MSQLRIVGTFSFFFFFCCCTMNYHAEAIKLYRRRIMPSSEIPAQNSLSGRIFCIWAFEKRLWVSVSFASTILGSPFAIRCSFYIVYYVCIWKRERFIAQENHFKSFCLGISSVEYLKLNTSSFFLIPSLSVPLPFSLSRMKNLLAIHSLPRRASLCSILWKLQWKRLRRQFTNGLMQIINKNV